MESAPIFDVIFAGQSNCITDDRLGNEATLLEDGFGDCMFTGI
jgi:hypothetical protein